MKKYISTLFIFACIGSMILASCRKNSGNETPEPTVSISADASFNDENAATITLKLSAASTSDVIVELAKADPQSGKKSVTANFTKKVTIKAGSTSQTVEAEADVLGLEEGDYQSAIKIAAAQGAKIAQNSVVYINFTYVFKPEVNLYAGSVQFATDKTAKLTLSLSKATMANVTVTLGDNAGSKATTKYDKTVTIPAGETQKDVVVTVDVPENLEPATYPVIIDLLSVENGVKGNAASATINLVYPFEVPIAIDGDFADWNDPSIATWTLPTEGIVLYKSMKTLKLTATAKYLYVFFEFEDPGFDFNMPFDMFIDADGNSATGGTLGAIDNDHAYPPYADGATGLEFYDEISLHDGDHYNDFYSWGGLYKYGGKDGENIFSGLKNISGTYDGTNFSGTGTRDENGIGRVEVQLQRKFFGMTGTKVKIGVKNMDGAHGWACYGLLPQGTATDANDATSRTRLEMASITMPVYVE